MKQLLLHSLVISPIVRWITSPSRRWSHKTGVRIAMVGLILMGLIQLKRMEMNCFELIGVDQSATPSEISRGFRKQSASFHPDRQDPPPLPFGYNSTSQLFIQLQQCYEVISNPQKLNYYDRFGKLDFQFKNEEDFAPVMAVFSFIGYLVTFIVCTIFTSSPESKRGRRWIYSFLAFAFASEMYLKFLGGRDIFSAIPVIGNWLVFEQVAALATLVPSVLSSCILLSQITHVDDSEVVNKAIQATTESTREISNFVTSKRRGETPASVTPAFLKIMKQPVAAVPVPPTPVIAREETDDGSIPEEKEPTSGGLAETTPATTAKPVAVAPVVQQKSLFQKIINWLFILYVMKILFSSFKQLIM